MNTDDGPPLPHAEAGNTGQSLQSAENDRDEARQPMPSPPKSSWWKDTPAPVKVFFFVVAPVWMLLSLGTCSSTNAVAPEQQDAGAGTAVPSKEWLSGNWVMTPKGGEDGQTSCDDFNVDALYNLNGNSAKLLSFASDGKYRSLFTYTAPSGTELTQLETSDWSLDKNIISRQNVVIDNAPSQGSAEDNTAIANAVSENILTLDYQGATSRFVRCVGNVHDILELNTAAPAPQNPAAPSTFDLAGLCSNQETINGAVKPFRSAVGQVLLGLDLNTPPRNGDEAFGNFLRAYVMGDRLSKIKYRFLNIKNLGVDGYGTDTVTVRCQANLRLVEPLQETNGAFSSFLQFNNASYSIRIKNADSDNPETYLLAVIQPVNGQYDITAGTE